MAADSNQQQNPYPMKNPRLFYRSVSIFALLLFASTSFTLAQSGVQTAESQAALTPDEALALLMEGNERFVSGQMVDRDLSEQVSDTASGQYPFAVVLGCIDSRVPAEIVFDQGVGDIFTARVAGNFVNTDILGSMEFATAVAGARLIMVLGHTECGAVKGACDDVELGNLTSMLDNIEPAVEAIEMDGPRNSSNKEFVDAVTHKNVHLTVEDILEESEVIADQVENGTVRVVGAIYDVSTGRVTILD